MKKYIFALAIFLPILSFAAWSQPSVIPPLSNTQPPINVGAIDQIKGGMIGATEFCLYKSDRATPIGCLGNSAGTQSFPWIFDQPHSANANQGNNETNIINTNPGNVGIGTTNPKSKLEVVGSQRWAYNDSGDYLGYNLELNTVVTPNNVRYSFGQRNNGIMHNNVLVMNKGNVGIGTTNPRSKLDVWNGDLMVTGTGTNGTAYMTSRNGNAYFSNNTYDNGIAITSGGNIGIGVANPGAKLEVNGTGKFLGTLSTKTPPLARAITAATSGAIEIPEVNVGSSAGFITALHQTSIYSQGYRQHLSLGNFRDAYTWNGGFFVGLGGSDNNPTEYFLMRNGGTIGHSSGVLGIGGKIKIADGTQGAGKVLTSDANGLASWGSSVGGIQGSGTNGNITKWISGNALGSAPFTEDDVKAAMFGASLWTEVGVAGKKAVVPTMGRTINDGGSNLKIRIGRPSAPEIGMIWLEE